MHLSCNSATELFHKSLFHIFSSSEQVVVKEIQTRELLGFSGSILNPYFRWISCPPRRQNFFASCAETLWVLAGRNDMEFLSKFLPRALDFSDDGKVWRAGYGKRLYSYGSTEVNQLDNMLDLLRAHPDSRQAVCVIWNPELDVPSLKSRDFPCCNHFQILVRNNRVHGFLTMRSNDVIWGASSINWIEFTVIQELFLYFLNQSLGEEKYSIGAYTHRANSYHIYDDGRVKFDISALATEGPFSEDSPYVPQNVFLEESPENFDCLAHDIERFIIACLTSRDSLLEVLNDLTFMISLPRCVSDMMYVSASYLLEKHPLDSHLLQYVKDPNLRRVLLDSFIAPSKPTLP